LKDNGAGIPPDMLESIFDLFVQSRRTLDRAAGGLGVGLTLVRSLARMHGGTVSAHSEGEGKGSEFVLRLPLVASSAAPGRHLPVRDLEAGEDQGCALSALPDGAMVVVVEDNRDSREMLCELLQLSGFRCRTADTGTAALALIEEVRPDIAILDVGLPEMDGFELARRIRKTRGAGEICLIALTGYGQPSDHAIGVEAGFDAHLVKPVQAEQLLALMTNLRLAPASRAAAQS
jgi:two-component system CheB/CheR fusion protein